MKISAFQRLKPNKSWVVLGVALTVGLLAALGARSFLSSQVAAIEARAKGRPSTASTASRSPTRSRPAR